MLYVVVPDDEMLISEIPEPRHGRIRRIVNSAIAAHRLGRVEPFAREFTRKLIDDAIAAGRIELVHDLVTPIPSSVNGVKSVDSTGSPIIVITIGS